MAGIIPTISTLLTTHYNNETLFRQLKRLPLKEPQIALFAYGSNDLES